MSEQRWREALDPTIRKDGWTEQEDDLLVEAFRRVGRKWNEIAAALNGRPPVQVSLSYSYSKRIRNLRCKMTSVETDG
jgi:Myb-like DNA-binding domain